MALPNFEEFRQALASAKRDDQTWGNLLRELNITSLKGISTENIAYNEFLSSSGVCQVLAEWDFYSSPSLDLAVVQLDVKSWQLIEFVESVRESLSIAESDLIVYELEPVASPNSMPRNEDTTDLPSSRIIRNQDYVSQAQDPVFNNYSSYGESANLPLPSPEAVKLAALLIFAGIIIVPLAILALTAIFNNQKSVQTFSPTPSQTPEKIQPHEASEAASLSNASSPGDSRSMPSSDKVFFKGIDLPVTNKLCNAKGTFCILGLATLVTQEAGEASYAYSETVNGEQINIRGTISVSNLEKEGDRRAFTFAFRDDQGTTSQGWAAAGFFNLDQDKDRSKQGLLTRFKTTESFGPKTPVGLENTSYLFPN